MSSSPDFPRVFPLGGPGWPHGTDCHLGHQSPDEAGASTDFMATSGKWMMTGGSPSLENP